MNDSRTLYLFDGTAFAFRGFYAIPTLSNAAGLPTNAVYGFGSMLRSLLNEYQPRYAAVAFDLAGGSFRDQAHEAYKANRQAPPDDFIVQIPYIRRFVEGMGLRIAEQEGYEADDVIGTLATRAAAAGMKVIIVSPDKDMLQLVTDRIHVLRDHAGNRKIYNPDAFQERYTVPPERMTDLMGLMGDTSDNIPGVPGIGEKTAIALIHQFGSLEGVYNNLSSITGKKRLENLAENRDQAFLSKDLATIETNLSLPFKPEDCAVQKANQAELASLYRELGFDRWLRDLGTLLDAIPLETGRGRDYRIITSDDAVRDLAAKLRASGGFAFDTETTALDALRSELVGMSFSFAEGQGFYIPVGHREGPNANESVWRESIAPLLADVSLPKYAHNGKYDALACAAAGLELRGLAFDTMIASALIDSSGRHNLDAVSLQYLGLKKIPTESLIGRGTGAATMAEAPADKVGEYAAEDADAAFSLVGKLKPLLESGGLIPLFEKVEMPLVAVLVDMERAGIRIDREALEEQRRQSEDLINECAAECYKEAGSEFNLNSPQQLATILYDRLKLPTGRNRSTEAGILEALAAQGHKLPARVLEYRQVQKIKSTYLEALGPLIHPADGRVHTSYRQIGANTGRLASSEPNLQNIPVRTPIGRRVRQVFIPSEGCVLLSADYSQIELRVVAHLAGDEGLASAFAQGEDIHARTAAEIFGIPLKDVAKEQRESAKAINFGLIYGMSAYGLAKRLGIDKEEAQDYIDRYFSRYPGVKTFITHTVEQARLNREVKTLLGRRIRVPGIDDSNRLARENAERAAINAPVQGTAADMLKVAMVQVQKRLSEGGFKTRMILTVHDELIFDTPLKELDSVRSLVVDTMIHALPLTVPVVVDTRHGANWGEL